MPTKPPKLIAIQMITKAKQSTKENLNMLFNIMSSGKEHPAAAIRKLIVIPSGTPDWTKASVMGIIAEQLA